MAMTPKHWTISALAVEFRLDRRTVARRLDGIRPVGSEKGADVWRLDDVAAALVGGQGREATGGTIEALALRLCALTAPAVFAREAVKAGLSVEVAWRLFLGSRAAMFHHAADVAENWVACPSPFAEGETVADLEAVFLPPDWEALAAQSGEVVDLEAWAGRLDHPFYLAKPAIDAVASEIPATDYRLRNSVGLDACTIHGLLEALDILASDSTPAISSIITVARPLAKKLANDLSLQW